MFIQVDAMTTDSIAMLKKPEPEDSAHWEVGRCSVCSMSLNRP
jgi:hypothetical protein